METKKFFELFGNSAKRILKNPIFIVPGILLWTAITLFSRFSVFVNQNLSNSIHLTISVIMFWIIMLAIMSFVFSGLIAMASLKKKAKIGEFFRYGKKFWFKNFWIMLIIALLGMLIGRIADKGAFLLGTKYEFNLLKAQIVFFLIYAGGLIGVLIFFTFASFYLVSFNLTIIESIKKSFKLVKNEYLATLALSVLSFVVLFLINKTPKYFGEFLEYVLFLPLAAQIFIRFVLKSENQK